MADSKALAKALYDAAGEGAIHFVPASDKRFAPLVEAGLAVSGPAVEGEVPFKLTSDGLALAQVA